MKDREFFAMNLWRWKCELVEKEEEFKYSDINEARKAEWFPLFEKLMRNRLVVGAFRYGKNFTNPDKLHYDRCSSMIARIKKYEKSGNLEYLVDVANLAMLEFAETHHPKAHFHSIDDGEHVKHK